MARVVRHGQARDGTYLVSTCFGPGMIKTFLTVRTGNAWVHVWAHHELAPHTLIDTDHLVDLFHIC